MAEITVLQVDERPLSRAEREQLFRGLAEKTGVEWAHFRSFLELEDELNAARARAVIPEVPLLLLRRIADYGSIVFTVSAIQPVEITGASDPGLPRQISDALKSISESAATRPAYKSTAELVGAKRKDAPGLLVAMARPQPVVYVEDEQEFMSGPPRLRRRLIYCASAEDSISVLRALEDPQYPLLRIYIDSLEKRNPVGFLRSGRYGDRHVWNAVFGRTDELRSHPVDADPSGNAPLAQAARNLLYRSEPPPFFVELLMQHLKLWPRVAPGVGAPLPAPETRKDLPGFIPVDLREYEPLFGLTFSDEFVMSTWLDVATIRMTAWLERLLCGMPDSGELANFKQERFRTSVERETAARIIAHNFEERWYRWIYERKFRPLEEPPRPAGVVRVPQVAVSLRVLIPKEEWKLVQLEYKKEQELREQARSAPWSRPLRRLVRSGFNDRRAWEELQPFISEEAVKAAGTEDWIRSPDGAPILCPHVRDLTLANLKDDDAAAAAVVDRYKGAAPLQDNYYCRVCGEVLLAESPLEGVISREEMALISADEEPLREFIWKQTSHIVRGFVVFRDIKAIPYVNQFISAVAESLHGFISVMEQRLRKSKTATRDVITNKLKLFTSLYVFATLMRIVSDNPRAVRFSFMDFGKHNFDTMMRAVFPRFMSYNDTLINKLPDVSEEFLRDAFNKAYQNVQKLSHATIQEAPPVEESPAQSAVWQYAHRMQIILATLGKASRAKTVIDAAKEPPAESPKLPEAKGYFRYALESFRVFMRYVQSRVYVKHYYNVSIIREGDDYKVAVSVTAPYQELAHFSQTMRELEAAHRQIEVAASLRCYGRLPFRRVVRFDYKSDPSALAFFYGAGVNKAAAKYLEGPAPKEAPMHRHRWAVRAYTEYKNYRGPGIYAYQPDELKLEPRMPAGCFLVDVLCAVCNHSQAKVREEIPDIARRIQEHMAMEAFFNYYTFRCPKPKGDSPFHVGSPCEGCGMLPGLDRESAEGKKYYEQYRKLFEAAQAARPQARTHHKEIPRSAIPEISTAWKFNANLTSEFVSATTEAVEMNKKKYQNFVRNLGYSEFAVYEDILAGSARPHAEATPQMRTARANWLQNYVYTLGSFWSIFINHRNFAILDPGVKAVVDGLTPAAAAALARLPPVSTLYKELREPFPAAARRMRLHPEFDEFVYEYLLGLLLAMFKHLRELKPVFNFLINVLVDAEESHSDIREQKAVSVEAAQKADPFNDPNMQDHSISREFDDMVGPESRDKYKYDIDYDGHNETINE